ncbi:MAG: glycoside hydrolase family 140 protein [Acidobacteria bacterium]|nr:glycoside hydrolase family 140 protein [Acidobacteriota bacterium]
MRSNSIRILGVAIVTIYLLLAATANAADDLTKPIRVSPDGHFLVQPDGQPFFWLGDTAWAIFVRSTREEADGYLKDRAHMGFTVIQAVAIGGTANPMLGGPNRFDAFPLIDSDPALPNPKYFEHVDWVVNRAAQYGLRIAMLPVWGDAVTGGYGEGGPQVKFNSKEAQAYGRWLAARYRHKGIIWVLGGDLTPLWKKDFGNEIGNGDIGVTDYRPVFDAMAQGITEGDGDNPFITYHPACCSWSGTAHPRTSLYFHDRDWLDMNMLQSSHFLRPECFLGMTGMGFAWNATFNYEPISDEYHSKPTRPVIDGEARYENLPSDTQGWGPNAKSIGFWAAYDSRNAAYHSVFAGAAGYTYGNNSVFQFLNPEIQKPLFDAKKSWKSELDTPGAQQMRHVKTLMLSRPYFTHIPDQSIIVGDAGEGTGHIGATRDKDGSYAKFYLPHGQPITVDMSKIAGLHAVAWWFNPRSGTAQRVEGRFPTTGTATFNPPSRGAESDWVLVVDDESKGFGAPGAKL